MEFHFDLLYQYIMSFYGIIYILTNTKTFWHYKLSAKLSTVLLWVVCGLGKVIKSYGNMIHVCLESYNKFPNILLCFYV